MSKPILCLDFDGVIHSYTSGWKGADNIPDTPVDGAIQFIMDAREKFEIHIFSSRSHQDGGIIAMQAWLRRYLHEYLGIRGSGRTVSGHIVYDEIKWPTVKPPAMITIDDRALTFTGVWPSVSELLEFKPWNK